LPPISPPLFLNLSLLLESFFSFLSLFVLELEPLRRFSEPDELQIEDTEAEAVGSDELVRFNNLKLYLLGCDGSSLRPWPGPEWWVRVERQPMMLSPCYHTAAAAHSSPH